jgi:hypothetical protein
VAELDLRIITVGIEVNGNTKYYSDFNISIVGTKYANENQNECEIKISNLDKTTSDFILTETSPFNLNKTPKRVIVQAGRASYGVSTIFRGDVASSVISQPPDTTITLKCLTNNFDKGNIIARNQAGVASLKNISTQVAKDLNLKLNFQATDKTITNYTYTGAALKQVENLGSAGFVSAYIDDGQLIVKNLNLPLTNSIRIVDINNGMVGIPELTEEGVKVKFLLDNQTQLGGLLRVRSIINPGANGDYVIFKLGFELATRDVPFYYTAEAKRV